MESYDYFFFHYDVIDYKLCNSQFEKVGNGKFSHVFVVLVCISFCKFFVNMSENGKWKL